MGHPKDTIQFGVPLPSADGNYRSRYPDGDWPGIPANAAGAGVTRPTSSPVGIAVGAAVVSGSGISRPVTAPQGGAAGNAGASGAGVSAVATAPAGSASFGGQAGLQFPGNGVPNSDIRLNWLGANLLSRTSQTVITKVRYTQQTGYYALIWSCHNDGTFKFDKYEFGAHPYPTTGTVDETGQSTGGTQDVGTVHFFEIAGLGEAPAVSFGHDYLSSPNNLHGAPRQVVKGRDYIHIRTVAVEGSNLVHRFWPDAVNDPTFRIEQSIPLSSLPSSAAPVFLLGCSPWTSSNFAATGSGATNSECPSCILRGIKLFSQPLSFSDALAEAQSGLNSAVTTTGQASVWYMNENPTPSDITDKSGANHTPTWANANRPGLFSVGAASGSGVTNAATAPSGTASGGGAAGITFFSGFAGSGTFADGQTVTINRSGGGWGTKPGGGKPLYWIPLEQNLQIDPTYSRSAPSRTAQVGCTYQTAVKPAGAAGCAKQDIAALGQNKAALYAESPPFVVGNGVDPIKCYVSVKRWHNHPDNNGEGGPCNDKTIRFYGASGSGDGSGHSVYYSIGAGLALCFVEGVNPLDPEFPVGDSGRFYSGMNFGSFDNNAFVQCEHFFKEGSISTFDGIWSNARDGRLTHAFDNNWVTRDGANDPLMATFYLDEFSNGTYVGNIYFHSLYIDNSFARVFVSDESSFSTATGPGTHLHREICIPVSWSDTSITFLLRKGSHASLTGKYLYVANDDNVVTRVGQFT